MIIGIDLGTTNSLAACFRNGEAELIPNRLGKYLTPSVKTVLFMLEKQQKNAAYDVNSLLEVEVYVHSTGVRRKIIIQNEQNRISEEEAASRLEKLQYLKQKPRDEEVNQLQILRGERLYEEVPERRYEIDRALMEFEQVLSHQNRTEIEQARKQLIHLLDKIEYNLT